MKTEVFAGTCRGGDVRRFDDYIDSWVLAQGTSDFADDIDSGMNKKAKNLIATDHDRDRARGRGFREGLTRIVIIRREGKYDRDDDHGPRMYNAKNKPRGIKAGPRS